MTTTNGLRALIVDDEASVRKVLSQVLKEDGYEVQEAHNGKAALQLFEEAPFPLVISDIVMPGMNGIDLLQHIKEVAPDTQFIIITSHASMQTAIEALRSGAYDYLFKPFADLDLISAVTKRAAEKIKLQAENRKLIDKLKKQTEELEKRVQKRTAELELLNSQLVMEIEERVRAQDAAEAANRAKGAFLTRMSHELRAPLNHVIGFTEIVLSKHFGELNEVQEEYLVDILKSSRNLLALINKLLDFSTNDNGQWALSLKEVDVRQLLQDSIKIVEAEAAKRNINLSMTFDGINGRVRIDAGKLEQILYNLLSNAVESSPEGGRVRVDASLLSECHTRPGRRWNDPKDLKVLQAPTHQKAAPEPPDGKGLQISVSDTGPGIHPERKRRIFEDDGRTGAGSKQRSDQAGGGLRMTRSLVESHGGRMWLESRKEDKGNKFNFVIPLC
jgi:signal transduction histidine kinase